MTEATRGGAALDYGNFLTVDVNFVIAAFVIFLMIETINRLREHALITAPAPIVPPEDILLQREFSNALLRT